MEPPTLRYRESIRGISGRKSFIYLARAKEYSRKGIEVINFGIGQPDIPTPKHIVEEAKRALDNGFTGYTESVGILELREAVAEYLNTRYGSDVKTSEIIITPGALSAIYLAMISFLDPGDEVIVIEPSYPPYTEIAKFIGAIPRYVPMMWMGSEEGFRLDLESLENSITKRTKMIILNNPHNPTGAVVPPRDIERLFEIAKSYRVIILADEIYDNFILEETPFKSTISFSEWRDYLLYVNGFSKTFSMTGWRLGYLVAREEVIAKLSNLAVNIWSCPTSFVQKAGVIALKGPWEPVKEMINLFRKRRDYMVTKLREIRGVEVWPSKATFYLFPSIEKILSNLSIDVDSFAEQLLEKKYVVVLPGTAFPDKAGKNFLRLSFSLDIKLIEKGIERFKEFIDELIYK